jgi:hypothetical protein
MNIAIIGSRTFLDYNTLKQKLDEFVSQQQLSFSDITIVSGGAKGADSLAEMYANENYTKLIVFKPDWEKFGRGAGYRRNVDIINNADIVFAFWDGASKGTKHSIDIAEKQGKAVITVEVK